jgi:nucleotide-binding universal stress UspA family protein
MIGVRAIGTARGRDAVGFSAIPPSEAGPVILVTLGVPFDRRAVAFAVGSAVEAGTSLLLVNVVDLEPLACAQAMGYNHLESPQMAESLRRPAELAARLGVEVERLRIKSFRPVRALVEIARERRAGLLVFGPDRRSVSSRRYRRASRAVCDDLSCLIWMAE